MFRTLPDGSSSYVSAHKVNASNGSKRLSGKVAVVTASTEGIGYAIAERLGREGASVVISSRKEANVKKALEALRNEGIVVEGVVCHVGKSEHRKNIFETTVSKFGGIDILVSNAASSPTVAPILETEESVWDKIFETNVRSSWLLAKEVYPYLQKRGGGNIVFISSIAGYNPSAPLGTYSISKTTLLGLTRAIASEVALENIRVNCVAPGVVATKLARAITNTPEVTAMTLRNTPMQRVGKPSEIAGVVAFLVSEDASYITGENVVVAGGAFCHL